jgi:SHQ1 protein
MQQARNWLHEIVHSETVTTTTTTIELDDAAAPVAANDIAVDDTAPRDDVSTATNRKEHHIRTPPLLWSGYGFARMFRDDVFHDLTRDGLSHEMLECPLPLLRTGGPIPPPRDENDDDDDDESTQDEDHGHHRSIQSQRRQLRIQQYENRKFSIERYVIDWNLENDPEEEEEEDGIYQNAIRMIPHWHQTTATPTTTSTNTTTNNNNNHQEPEDFFSALERQLLMSIPYPLLEVSSSSYNITTIPATTLDRSIQLRLWIGLLDLLFAYVYDHITTDGEPTVESA